MSATRFQVRRAISLAALALLALGLQSSGHAASISYGNFGPVVPGVTFINVTESSTDPVPLFGPPTPFAVGLDFDPIGFAASAAGGSQDKTAGKLEFTIASGPLLAITDLGLAEAGDFTLAGVGSSATQAIASALLSATVTQVNGVNVAPINLIPVNASVGFNLLSNPGIVQPWSLGLFLNVAGQLGPGQWATSIDVLVDNELLADSEARSLSFLSKKDFRFTVSTQAVPEPTSLLLLACGGLGCIAAVARRRS